MDEARPEHAGRPGGEDAATGILALLRAAVADRVATAAVSPGLAPPSSRQEPAPRLPGTPLGAYLGDPSGPPRPEPERPAACAPADAGPPDPEPDGPPARDNRRNAATSDAGPADPHAPTPATGETRSARPTSARASEIATSDANPPAPAPGARRDVAAAGSAGSHPPTPTAEDATRPSSARTSASGTARAKNGGTGGSRPGAAPQQQLLDLDGPASPRLPKRSGLVVPQHGGVSGTVQSDAKPPRTAEPAAPARQRADPVGTVEAPADAADPEPPPASVATSRVASEAAPQRAPTPDIAEGHRERLRARFDRGEAFADYELLELLLHRTIPRRDTKPIAKALVREFGSFAAALSASPARLAAVAGVGERVGSDFRLIRAAAERFAHAELEAKPVLGSTDAVVAFYRAKLRLVEREEFHVMYLDKKNQMLASERSGVGTVDHTPVYPREVVKRALELAASAVVLVHNHPSGDPSPSRADITMTAKIVDAAAPLGIAVHDHLIIGANTYVSLRAEGHI